MDTLRTMRNIIAFFIIALFLNSAFADSPAPAVDSLPSEDEARKELLVDLNWAIDALKNKQEPVIWFLLNDKVVSYSKILEAIEEISQEKPWAAEIINQLKADNPWFIEALQENEKSVRKITGMDYQNETFEKPSSVEINPLNRTQMRTKLTKLLHTPIPFIIGVGALEVAGAGWMAASSDYSILMKPAVLTVGMIGGITVAYGLACARRF